LIDPELQKFAGRTGNKIDGLVGIDLGGTTIEALTYLFELPQTRLRIVRSGRRNVVFHPKVYEFSGPGRWSTVIGSSNLSAGGLHSNIECSVIVEGTTDPNPFDAVFATYDAAPFKADNVRLVDKALLEELAPLLAPYEKKPPDRAAKELAKGVSALDPNFKPPSAPGRPPSPAHAAAKKSSAKKAGKKAVKRVPPVPAATPTGAQDLYMELWDETGGGTQVQIASRAFTDFFGATPTTITYIRLDTPAGPLGPIYLQSFDNVTFRIGLPFVGPCAQQAGRRGVLRFRRVGPDHYRVDLRRKGHSGYDKWLNRCDQRTTVASKRFGIH
jgi:hypothetical protein